MARPYITPGLAETSPRAAAGRPPGRGARPGATGGAAAGVRRPGRTARERDRKRTDALRRGARAPRRTGAGRAVARRRAGGGARYLSRSRVLETTTFVTSAVNFACASMTAATHSTSVCSATWRWTLTIDCAVFSVRFRYSLATFFEASTRRSLSSWTWAVASWTAVWVFVVVAMCSLLLVS